MCHTCTRGRGHPRVWALPIHCSTARGQRLRLSDHLRMVLVMEGFLITDPRFDKAQLGSNSYVSREVREAHEELMLSPTATRANGAGHRVHEEEADPLRTCFERDRDRILHSPAFRRLAGKTQVFIFPGDHQRTRLTHALEVAQVATAISRAVGLNVALTEAIALGHDCGHGPGGHASEEAFSPFLDGGYHHAVWGADVVLQPLNLCAETLDGIRNHSWSRPAPSTPEAEVVRWADRIAYVCHDFEDAVAANVLGSDALPHLVSQLCGTTRSSQINALINGVVAHSNAHGNVGMTAAMTEALGAFRAFNFERIYLRPASNSQADAVIRLLRALVEHLAAHPELLHENKGASDVVEDPVIAAVSYVAGMTDRYACRMAIQHLGWAIDDLPRGFDLF